MLTALLKRDLDTTQVLVIRSRKKKKSLNGGIEDIMSVKNKQTTNITQDVWFSAKLLTETLMFTTLLKRDLDITDLGFSNTFPEKRAETGALRISC